MAEATNYYTWILRLAAPYIGSRVAEVGAGVGNFAAVLLREARISELLLIEPASNLFSRLTKRFKTDGRVKVLPGFLGDHSCFRGLDSLIAVNVIEHIRDDAEFLRLAFRALAPGGTVVLFAPALRALYGTLDESFEHYRRYSKSELISKLTQAYFRPEKVRYFNLAGVLTWLMAGRLLRRKTLEPRQVWFYDRWLVPWVSRAEQFWEPPVGQSLLAIARKPVVF